MQRLRLQVDQTDLKILKLLQQRTKLSRQIGQMKRRHGAVIYVPERERELVARLTRLSKGQPSARAVAALYREIMSSSRAAQGQAPIGLLGASAASVLPASSACFGACDRFEPKRTWPEVAKGLVSGKLALALLTGADLAGVMKSGRWRCEFFDSLTVVGDFAPVHESGVALARRIFIVTPSGRGGGERIKQALILIECKSTQNAIKSLLHSMPDISFHAEPLADKAATNALVRLTLARPMDGMQFAARALEAGKETGVALSILGMYPGTEVYGG